MNMTVIWVTIIVCVTFWASILLEVIESIVKSKNKNAKAEPEENEIIETNPGKFLEKTITYSMCASDPQVEETVKFLKDKLSKNEWGGAIVPYEFDEKQRVHKISIGTIITHEELYKEHGGKE